MRISLILMACLVLLPSLSLADICAGEHSACDTYLAEPECTGNTSCAWDVSCSGDAYSCDSFDENTCPTMAGCSWIISQPTETHFWLNGTDENTFENPYLLCNESAINLTFYTNVSIGDGLDMFINDEFSGIFSMSEIELAGSEFGDFGLYNFTIVNNGNESFLPSSYEQWVNLTYCEECAPDWSCTEWGECLEGYQNRSCEDLNTCGDNRTLPAENQECSEPLNSTFNVTSACCPIYTTFCSDNSTLAQMWNTSSGVSFAYQTCANGCDDVTNSCAPPKLYSDILNVGIIVLIFAGVIAFAKFLGGRK